MSSISAKPPLPNDRRPRRVVILVYPGVTLLDATGPAQVFAEAGQVAQDDVVPYEIISASRHGGMITSDTGIALGTVALEEAASAPIDTLLVAGGLGVFEATGDRILVDWVKNQAGEARRTGSTCMGAFLTAAAGLLDGRRAVTHWRWCQELQDRHPDLRVESGPIFIRDGKIWSSAGVTAGIDLALAMVEEDHGHDMALEIARRLVVFLKRPGGQAQFSAALSAQTTDREGGFEALHAWIAENLACDLRVERLAAQAGMSPRTFARDYSSRTRTTPARAVESMRVEAAKRLLEDDRLLIKTIAARCGFKDYEGLRRAFLRQTGIAPIEYRRRFGSAQRVPPPATALTRP
jgi:transcriptional regulator GlxA family with amidase domain